MGRAVRRGDGGLSLLTLQEVQDVLVGTTLLATEERKASSGLTAVGDRAAAAGDTEQHSPRHKQLLSVSLLCSPERPHRTAVQTVGGGEDVALRSTRPQGNHSVLHHTQWARLLL